MDPTRQIQCGDLKTSRSQADLDKQRIRHWQDRETCHQRSHESTHEKGGNSKTFQAKKGKVIWWQYNLRKILPVYLTSLSFRLRVGAPNLDSNGRAGGLLRRDQIEGLAPLSISLHSPHIPYGTGEELTFTQAPHFAYRMGLGIRLSAFDCVRDFTVLECFITKERLENSLNSLYFCPGAGNGLPNEFDKRQWEAKLIFGVWRCPMGPVWSGHWFYMWPHPHICCIKLESRSGSF